MTERRYHHKVVTVKLNPFSKPEKHDQQIAEAINRAALEGYEFVTANHAYGGHPRLYFRR